MHSTMGYKPKSLNYAETTEQSNADKSRLDREGCLSDFIVSVGKRAGIGSTVLALPCRNTRPRLHEILISRAYKITAYIRNTQ